MSAYLPRNSDVDGDLAAQLTETAIAEAVADVPEEWAEAPQRYVDYLVARVREPRSWLPEAAA
jgi:hypothetical protein